MSDLENPHYHRKAGYAMIMVAASLAAIGILHITIGEDVLFSDTIQRDKTEFFEMCKAGNYLGEGCEIFEKKGNTLYEIPRLNPDGTMDEADIELTQEMESVPQTIVETVIIPEGSGAPGCEETNECYIPSMLNISNGTTVSWENIDGAAHFATSGTPDGGPDGIFDSGMIGPNSVYEYEFSNVGEFEYYCLVHPWMTGIIVVE